MHRPGFKQTLVTTFQRWRDALRPQDPAGTYRAPLRLLTIVVLSALVGEVLVMLVLSSIPPLSVYQRALLDGLLLVALLIPALYLFLVRPLASEIARRRRTETALRRSEERFRTLADFTHDWEYWIEPGGEYLYNSPSCQRVTGFAPEDFEENPRLLQEITHPEDRDLVDAHFREEREDGETHSLDFRILTQSGEERWINHVCQQVRDGEGHWLGWRGSNRDITERKMVEHQRERLLQEARQSQRRIRELVDALRQERDLLETIMESTHASLAYLDPDFNFVRVNSAYAEQSGYRKRDLIGRNHFALFPDAENEAIFERVRDTGEAQAFHAKPFEFPDRPELGITYWDWTLVPTTDKDGEIQGLVLSLLDVTERERLMHEVEEQVAARTAELRVSEERFRTIFEQAAIGITLAGTDGRFLVVNPAFERITGYTAEELRQMGEGDITHPDDLDANDALHDELLSGERHQYTTEKRYRRKDGDFIQARLTASLVHGTDPGERYAIGMVEDITERKRAQAALMQAERLNSAGRLASSLAHEINNPLQAVIGCIGLAEESLDDGENQDIEGYLKMAHDELVRAAGLVAQLRDLSRPTEMPPGKPTDVNALIDTVLELLRKRLDSRGIRVTRQTCEDLPKPELAPDRIKQVFLNLVLNAIDAMPDGGELTITTRFEAASDTLIVGFADCGAGIPQGVMPHIFDPFFSTKDDGTGLGLFVSQTIAREHGGSIEVSSEEEQGSTFTVRLPVSRVTGSDGA